MTDERNKHLEDLQGVQGTASSVVEEFEEITEDFQSFKSRVSDLETDLQNSQENLKERNHTIIKQEVDIEQLRSTVDVLKTQNDGLAKQVVEVEQSQNRSENHNLFLQREQEKVAKLEGQVSSERQRVKDLSSQLSEKDAENCTKGEQLDRKSQENESLREKLKKSEDDCSATTLSIKDLEREVSELNETVEAQNERISRLSNKNEELEQGRVTNQRTIERLNGRVQKATQEARNYREKAQKEKNAAERSQQDLHQQIATLRYHHQSNTQTIQDKANEQQRIVRGHAIQFQEQIKQRESSILRLVTMFSGGGLTQDDVHELFDIDEEVTKAHQLAEKYPKTELPRLRYLFTQGKDYVYPEPHDEKRVQLIHDTLRLAYTSNPFNPSMAYNMQRLHLSASADEPMLEKGVVIKVVLHRLLKTLSTEENANLTNLIVVIQCVIWLHRQNTLYGDKVLRSLWHQLTGIVSRNFPSCSIITVVMNNVGTLLRNDDPSWSFEPLPSLGGWEDTTKTLSTIDKQWTLMSEGPEYLTVTDCPRTSNCVVFVPKSSLHRVFNVYKADLDAFTLSMEEDDGSTHRFSRDDARPWLKKYVPHVLQAKIKDSDAWKRFREQKAEHKANRGKEQKEMEDLLEKMDHEREKLRKEIEE